MMTRPTALLIAAPLLSLAFAYAGIRLEVYRVVSAHISTVDSLPASNTTGVVLGASVVRNETPSSTLQERLETAVTLYKTGKVSRLLMSGDGTSSPYYDEVKVMRQYALDHDVPETVIDIDKNGLRTYDTCYRLQNVYHFDKVVLVTQPDHLQRAVYTCRELGLDADGVETSSASSVLSDPSFFVREQEAVILAWIDVHILHPKPKNSTA